MLQKLREHSTGWIAKFIMGLLVVVFSFWGLQSYMVARQDTSVAHVGDLTISQQAYQQAMNQLRRRAQNSQSGLDPAALNTPEVRQQIIDGLVNRALLRQANEALGISVTSGMVRQQIAAIPAFQIQGKFDPTSYQAILRQQGMTPAGFEQKVRQDLETQVIPQAVNTSALVTSAAVDDYLRLSGQTRDLHYLQLPVPEVDPATVTDEDIQTWYQSHQEQYMSPEAVTIAYVEVNAEQLHVDASPSDAAIKERYEKQKNRFVAPERRKVSHILISVPDNATPEQQKKALAEAESIEAKLTEGASFADLAKQVSDDLGTRDQGGSLGWIEPGVTMDSFNEVAFNLPEGEVSDPVLTQAGYHLIKVTGIKPGATKSLAEVRDQLVREMLASARQRKYNDVAGQMVDLSYRNPSSLKPVARTLGLDIQTAGPFSRDGGPGIASHQDVVEAAFSEQVLTNGVTSGLVTIGDNDVVVLRVSKHTPAKPEPLASVRKQVRAAIVADRAATKAADQADAMLASARKEGSLKALAKSGDASQVKQLQDVHRRSPELAPPVLTELFKMPHPAAGNPGFAVIDTGDGHYTLVQLDSVNPADLAAVPEAQRKMIATRMQRMYGAAEVAAMLDIMRRGTEVKVNAGNIDSPLDG